MTRPQAPIGVFDSGVGGLSVLRALRAVLPGADFIYLGDTARLPYGTKSAASVQRYSLQCAGVLAARGIRCLVVACNTASASALQALRERHAGLPVIGVIEPGAAAAVAASRSQHIAVIATEGTVAGGAYQSAVARCNPAARVTALPCSLFVALAEEGWTTGPVAEAVAQRYFEPIFGAAARAAADVPDTLILGCTHFPALAGAIRAALPAAVAIVDSAASVAAVVARELGAAAGARAAEGSAQRGSVRWLATDGAARFARVSGVFLGESLDAEQIEIVDL